MSFELDPLTFTILFGGIFLGCGYLLGKWKGEGNKQDTMESTIDFLIQEGFVKAEEQEDGTINLIPFPPEPKRGGTRRRSRS